MAKSREDLLDAHARRHDALIDSTVAQFDRGLQPILGRAQAALTEELRGQLTILDNGRILRDRKTQIALRRIVTRFPQIMVEQGYDDLLGGLQKSFGRQVPMFDDLLEVLGVPKVTWRAADKRFFADQARAGVVALDELVRTISSSTYRTSLLQIGGLNPRQLAVLIADETGKTAPQASAIADTATSTFYRTIAARGYEIIQRAQPEDDELRYRYYGPKDKLNRAFCRHLLDERKAHTRPEIEAMRNPAGTDVFTHAGGWRCRHQWLLAEPGAVDAGKKDTPSAAVESTPKRPLVEPSTPAIAAAVERSFGIAELPSGLYSVTPALPVVPARETMLRRVAGVPRMEVAGSALRPGGEGVLLHEWFHHVDYALAAPGQTTVSNDAGTLIGHALAEEKKRLMTLAAPRGLEAKVAAVDDLFVREVYGSLSFHHVIESGHDQLYFASDFGRIEREAFASLGAVYALRNTRPGWDLIRDESPEVAAAFVKWMRSLK